MKQILKQYLYSDMASELYKTAQQQGSDVIGKTGNPLHDSGIDYTERYFGQIRQEKLVIATEEASAAVGKSIGTYYTVHTGDLRLLSEEAYECCGQAIRASLLDAMRQLCPDFRIPTDTQKNNEIGDVTADYGFDKGTVLPTALDDPGEDAWDRLGVSPEWDQGAHLYNAPPAAFTDAKASDGLHAEGEPFLSAAPDKTAVTDIPPAPASDLTPFRPMTVLVAGLGNPALTPDALGPMSTEHLSITRHLTEENSCGVNGFDSGIHRLCAITPLVLGQTGIETLELVRGAVRAVQPDLVILIDALAASELDTLTKTVQVSTTGIHPGGGVGNKRQPLNRDTLGVPVMTVGVPTVIAASTLVCRALEHAGILSQITASETEPQQNVLLHRALAAADAGYVAPKDIDASVAEFARLIAHGINAVSLGTSFAASVQKRI